MPLQRRIPKRGFNNLFGKEYAIINLKDIMRIEGIDIISPDVLLEKGIIKKVKDGLKVLGGGEITRPVTIKANAFSSEASTKIAAAGGRAEVI